MIPNPNLKPLKTTTYEVGADVKLFNNRLGFDIAVYTGHTKIRSWKELLTVLPDSPDS